MRLIVTALTVVLAVPVLLVGVAGAGRDGASGGTTAQAGGSDAAQVAALPPAIREAFLAAARRHALPPALLAALATVDAGFTPDTAGQLLSAGRLPGGGWDAARALTARNPSPDFVSTVLTQAAAYGYRYSPDGPPLDPDRYVFPIAAPAQYGPAHHDYPATDIFADQGAPVLACVRAEILRMSRTDRGKGGLSITLRGEDGWRYYYAHLDTIRADLRVGQVVEAGELLATNGKTGNARTTPPHLHLGISLTGSVAGELSPYPYLQTWPKVSR